MATFEKIDRAIISFDKNEIKDYTISGGNYAATITVTTLDGKMVDLKFDNNADLKSFIENILDCALHMDFSLSYPSHWRNAQSECITLLDVREWRLTHNEAQATQSE